MDWKIIPEFDSYGNATSVLSLTRDITDLKIAEIELNKSNEELSESKQAIEESLFGKNLLIQELSEVRDKLQIANNEKDKFFSIIAHDLKGPFSGFLGLTKIMVEDLNSFSINEIVEMNVLMKDSASNLYKLLENLLEWSLSQKGVTSFNPENCILGYIVNQIFAFMLNMAKAKEITLVNNILEEQYVTADIPMLNTIIRNLISNAIKFTPNGGIIEIGTIDQPSEGSIVIYVKDSGMGMSDEIKEKLFKIDSKITNVGTNNEKGTGLGLILCKEFIEKHGGRIWVESEIGKGSTFNFSLPIK